MLPHAATLDFKECRIQSGAPQSLARQLKEGQMRKLVVGLAFSAVAFIAVGSVGATTSWADTGRPNAYVKPNGWCDWCTAPISWFCNCQINPPIVIR